jgi:hypothetical protein
MKYFVFLICTLLLGCRDSKKVEPTQQDTSIYARNHDTTNWIRVSDKFIGTEDTVQLYIGGDRHKHRSGKSEIGIGGDFYTDTMDNEGTSNVFVCASCPAINPPDDASVPTGLTISSNYKLGYRAMNVSNNKLVAVYSGGKLIASGYGFIDSSVNSHDSIRVILSSPTTEDTITKKN